MGSCMSCHEKTYDLPFPSSNNIEMKVFNQEGGNEEPAVPIEDAGDKLVNVELPECPEEPPDMADEAAGGDFQKEPAEKKARITIYRSYFHPRILMGSKKAPAEATAAPPTTPTMD
uniref:Uncharacterized protein n=1 Tax=Lutzomyia longipalpis TaxID=7200 RepID=A0A1B0CJU9_LUTLO